MPLLKTATPLIDNSLFLGLGYPKEIKKHKVTDIIPRYLIYRNINLELLCEFLDKFKTETPSVKNANLSEYIKNQTEIKEWNVVLVSNTDEKVFIDWKGNTPKGERRKNEKLFTYPLVWNDEKITLGCSVRNQLKSTRHNSHYFISKNQIDDTTDRQVDLTIQNLKSNQEIKNQRKQEKKGLLLVYALDNRGTTNADYGKPIIGFSIHFPEIDNEKKTSYTATLFNGFDEEPMDDDDNPENE